MNILRKSIHLILIFIALGGIFMPSAAQIDVDELRQQIVEGVNTARQTIGVPALTHSDILTSVAQTHIHFYNDVGITVPDNIQKMLQSQGYIYSNLWHRISPNITTATQAITRLLEIDDVRRELLSVSYTDIGIGYIESIFGEPYILVLLASRSESVLPTVMPFSCPYPLPSYRIDGQDLTAPAPERTSQIKTLTDLYNTLGRSWLITANVPGAVIGLIDNGAFVWVNAYGYRDGHTYAPMTIDTVFDVASLSKSITAAITLQLLEQGRITLDMPVFDVVTAWRPITTYDLNGVTPYRLMSHMAGFPTANYPLFRDDFSPFPTLVDTLNGRGYRQRSPVTLINPPGETFAYSNAGYSVLQLFIEAVTGESFSDYARCAIFQPLGMTMSDFYLRPDMQEQHAMGHDERGTPLGHFLLTPALAPAGLHSTVPDFVRWMVALLAPPHNPNVLSSFNIRQMLTAAQDTNGQYGLGMYITEWEGETIPNHTGDSNGYTAYFQLLPDKRHGIIVLTNGENGASFNNRVVGQWLQWLKSTGEIVGISAEEKEAQRQTNITILLDLINQERENAQLEPLFANPIIMRDAQANSQMMAARDDVEWHELWGFANRMASLNYDFTYFYYWGAYGLQIDAQSTFNIWKQRPNDFDQIFMNANTTEIGLGVSTSGSGVNYYAVIVVER